MNVKNVSRHHRRSSLFAIFFVASLDNFGFGIVFILFAPLILDSSYGMLSPETALTFRNLILGVLFAAFPFTQFFGAPILGDYADRFGRKIAFYVSIVGTTIGYCLSAIAIDIHHVYLLIFSRLFTGFFAGNLSICLASIADLSPDEKTRGKNYGLVGVVWGVSWPIAMIVGGYLSDPKISPYFNPALPFWITAFLSILSLLAIYYYLIETHKGEKTVKIELLKALKDIKISLEVRAMRPFFVVLLFWTIGWGLSVQWYGAFSIEKFGVGQQLISWALIIQGLFWVCGGSFVNPFLLQRISSWRTGLIGLSWTAIFILFSSFGASFWIFSAVYWVSAIGAAFALSNSLNLISLASPEKMQGRAMGLSQSMMSLGWFIVPIIGSILGNLDPIFFHVIAAAMVFVAAGILSFFKPKIAT
ncbi:MAG TPA: MFS transporter [Rhabdochlamydiaceae bacterium]|nr:MFS transporter [Rhabdochlamydiaceae bacterium]